MSRSFSNRIFGGVCGGLANTLPLNAWYWRLIFILITLLTGGAGVLVYAVMWWLLPLDSPLGNRPGSATMGFISLLLAAAMIGLWFGREALGLAEAYWPLAFLIVAVVFLLKQIITRRADNIALGLVAVAVPAIALLNALGSLEAGAVDIALRAAPAVLVFLGLSIILRYRVRFGSWIALIVSVALVAGLVSLAYSSRVDVISTDQQLEVSVPNETDHDLTEISEDITTLLVNVRARDTDVTFSVNDDARAIEVEFIGSNNSTIDITYSEDDDLNIASMQLIERETNEFPLLEDIGRGELRVLLPDDIALGLDFTGTRSQAATLDMGELNLERLSFELGEGDVLVRLPQYRPLSPSVINSNGTWRVNDGDLRLIAPSELGLRLSFNRDRNAEPSDFDDLTYQLLLEPPNIVLASRQFDNLEAQMQYQVEVSGGRFSLSAPDN